MDKVLQFSEKWFDDIEGCKKKIGFQQSCGQFFKVVYYFLIYGGE